VKINFASDGSVSVDINPGDDEAKALRVIGALPSDSVSATGEPTPQARPDRGPRRVQRRTRLNSLNKKQYDMWSFLVDNDCDAGVHRTAAADYFGIGDDGAGQRLGRLVLAGFAYRVRQGFYRAIVPAEAEA
jgi:hypothetical protein